MSEKVSRYTGVSQLQLRVSRYTVQLSVPPYSNPYPNRNRIAQYKATKHIQIPATLGGELAHASPVPQHLNLLLAKHRGEGGGRTNTYPIHTIVTDVITKLTLPELSLVSNRSKTTKLIPTDQGAAKASRQEEFDHLFFIFGHSLVPFTDVCVIFSSRFFAQAPLAGLLLRQGKQNFSPVILGGS